MQIDIEAEPKGGLQIIAAIPPGRIQQLEGRNGIGKTAAVRLLELCTGSQPYVGRDTSWATLREQLGPTRIHVSQLKDGEELTFELRPADWPLLPEPVGDWLGQVRRNGAPFQWRDVPNLLRVTRVGGDETLGESLALQVLADADRLRLLLTAQEARRREWGDQIGRLQRLAEIGQGVDLARLRSDAESARDTYDEARVLLEREQFRVDELREIAVLLRKAERLQAESPRLESELLAIDEQERQLRLGIERADGIISDLLAAAAVSEEQAQRADKLSGLQRLRRDRRIRRRHEVERVAAQAGVATPVDLDAVTQDKREIEREIAQLRARRLTVDRAGLVLELIGDVSRPIGRANSQGLGEEVLAELEAGSITVAGAMGGLDRRRETLAGVSSDEARSLARQIDVTQRRLDALADLPRLVRLREKAEDDLAETNVQLDAVLRTLNHSASAAYRRAIDDRAALLDSLTTLSVTRGDLEAQIAALTSDGNYDELRAVAHTRATAQGLPPEINADDVEAAIPDAARAVNAAMERLGSVLRLRDETANRLADAEAGARASASSLASDPEFSWLADSAIGLMPALDSPVDEQLATLGAIARGANAVEKLLVTTLNDVQALSSALGDLATRLRSLSTTGRSGGQLTGPVRRHYEAVFSRELESPGLREALFDSSASIAVDLREMTVAWETPNGERQTRPLESFSSGQRAFAYTRVVMERQSAIAAKNRLMVLDEFGAFIAQDRFDTLVRYLRDQAIGSLADQILLILPLRQRSQDTRTDQSSFVGDGYLVNDMNE